MELRVQTHLHTVESKGTRIHTESIITLEQAVREALDNEIDVLAVTNHDTTRGYDKFSKRARESGILPILGIEVSTSEGHLIGLGVQEGIEKELRRGIDPLEAADTIKSCGGVVYIPHPFGTGSGLGEDTKEVDGAVEAFNPTCRRSENYYAVSAAKKLGRPMLVGADAHIPKMIPYATNVIEAEPYEDDVLRSLKSGKVRRFENCKYASLKDLKCWTMERAVRSYRDMKNKIKHGWPVDKEYKLKRARELALANCPILKPLELGVLELGVRTKENRVWDLVMRLLYNLYSTYAEGKRKEFERFLNTL